MQYEIEKLKSASFFLSDTAKKLEEKSMQDEEKMLLEADLIMHIERLILVAHSLRGVKINVEKAREIISLI